jgi:hypothetical protein
MEFWLSPNGQVREWLRHNAHLCAWLIIPAVLVVPVVSFILCQVVKWTTMLTTITSHLILLPVLVLVLVLIIGIIRAVLR